MTIITTAISESPTRWRSPDSHRCLPGEGEWTADRAERADQPRIIGQNSRRPHFHSRPRRRRRLRCRQLGRNEPRPTNKKLIDSVKAAVETAQMKSGTPVPIDLVTTSASA
jgi:K+-transporting ATPase c subunit